MDTETLELLAVLMRQFDSHTKDPTSRTPLASNGWVIDGETPESILHQLRDLLAGSGAEIIDIVRLFDEDADYSLIIDDIEFYHTMRTQFGFSHSTPLLTAAFKKLDTTDAGELSYDDFFEFVRGWSHSLDSRTRRLVPFKLVPKPQPARSGSMRRIVVEDDSDEDAGPAMVTPTLDEICWDAETVRTLLHEMLAVNDLSTTDLLRAWDRPVPVPKKKQKRHKEAGDDGAEESPARRRRRMAKVGHAPMLDENEWDNQIGQLFLDSGGFQDVWENELRLIVRQCFKIVRGKYSTSGSTHEARGDKPEITIVDLERWLDDPPARPALRLKTRQEVTLQQLRRDKKRAKEAARQEAEVRARRRHGKIDPEAVARVSEGIVLAAAKARLLADAREISLLQRQSWAGQASPPEMTTALLAPPPLEVRIAYRALNRDKSLSESSSSAYGSQLSAARAQHAYANRRQNSSLPKIKSAQSLAQDQLTRAWRAQTPTRRVAPSHSMVSLRSSGHAMGGHAQRYRETHMSLYM